MRSPTVRRVSRRSRRARGALAFAAGLVLLAACTGGPADGDAESSGAAASAAASDASAASGAVRAVGTTAAAVTPAVTMPLSWQESTVIDTGWRERPLVRGRYLAGFAVVDAGLEYSVIDSYGTVLWRAQRPATCTGFAVSSAGGKPVAVLTDAAALGDAAPGAARSSAESTGAARTARAWQTTASAFDMATGARLWGPVPVPGTVQGPGLVFGASAPAATMGEVGPRLALDPASGKVVADEARDAGISVIGEYDGVVVTSTADELRGSDAATGDVLWRTDAMPAAAAALANGAPAIPGGALIGAGEGGASLVGLAGGTEIADHVDEAGYDPLSGTWVWRTGTELFGASDRHDGWRQEISPGESIAAVDSGLVYVRTHSSVQAFNALTGRPAEVYPRDAADPFAVPAAVTTDGAGLFRVHGEYLLAAVQAPPS